MVRGWSAHWHVSARLFLKVSDYFLLVFAIFSGFEMLPIFNFLASALRVIDSFFFRWALHYFSCKDLVFI